MIEYSRTVGIMEELKERLEAQDRKIKQLEAQNRKAIFNTYDEGTPPEEAKDAI